MALSLIAGTAGCADPARGVSGQIGGSTTRVGESSAVQAAWVQYSEHGWEVRALTIADACPSLEWDGADLPLRERAPPVTVAPRGDARASAMPAVFKARSCETLVPANASRLRVARFGLPVPHAELHRIVLMGDSGCRMKDADDAFQDCSDPQAWPFASVNAMAARMHPDLVIHVGDLHYRESPCPAANAGCTGSPWGYGEDVWMADFFIPAEPLLANAPWVIARGNHEACNRAGLGWFRFLAPTDFSPTLSCVSPADDGEADFTHPYAVPLDAETQLIVFDSAAMSGKPYKHDAPAFLRYARLMDEVDILARAKPHSIFVNHHPALAFGGSASGQAKPGTAGLISVLEARDPARLYPAGVDLVVNGHVHMFQALDFSSGHPAEILTGNGGSQMEGHVDANSAFRTTVAPGAVLAHFETQPGFGFATLDRVAQAWELKEWTPGGELLRRCMIRGPRLDCDMDAHPH